MTDLDQAEADQRWLLDRARLARWAFPTSRSTRRVTRPGEDGWLAELDALRPRFAAAVESGSEASVEIAARTWRLWSWAGQDTEARRIAELALVTVGDRTTSWAVHLAYAAAVVAHRAGDLDGQRRHSATALEMAQSLGDPESLALAHLAASRAAFDDGDAAVALAHAQASYAAARQLPLEVQQAPLHLVAQSHRLAGDIDAAAETFTRSLELNREIRDPGMVAAESFNLGLMQMRHGRADEAEAVLATLGPVADDPYDAVLRGVATAGIAWARGAPERARALLDDARAIQAEHGVELATEDQADLDWVAARIAG